MKIKIWSELEGGEEQKIRAKAEEVTILSSSAEPNNIFRTIEKLFPI